MTGLDVTAETRDTESRPERKLIVKTRYPHRVVCKGCGHLLMKSDTPLKSVGIQIRCRSCKTDNEL